MDKHTARPLQEKTSGESIVTSRDIDKTDGQRSREREREREREIFHAYLNTNLFDMSESNNGSDGESENYPAPGIEYPTFSGDQQTQKVSGKLPPPY